MRYVDGFVLAVPTKNLPAYRRMSQKAGKVWMEHGALQYVEALGDDLEIKMGIPFPQLAKMKRGEAMVFSWILYKSRSHRDRVNAKVMKDPRIANLDPKAMPFDVKRMSFGGFRTMIDY
jgi:uncharacterized protein YbaA (DUF1428 family)